MAEKQFVVFKLGDENYCIDILNVAGISEYKEITKVPNAPYFVDGIMNLRGEIIPIINLKKRFNITSDLALEDHRIILINYNDKSIGFLVDEANQVTKIDDSQIDPTPEVMGAEQRQYISGIGKKDEQLYIILELEKVLSDAETQAVLELDYA